MQAAVFFETTVTVYQSTLRHIPVECNFKRYLHTDPKWNTGAMPVTFKLEAFNLPERFFGICNDIFQVQCVRIYSCISYS